MQRHVARRRWAGGGGEATAGVIKEAAGFNGLCCDGGRCCNELEKDVH